jgi:hypothetical protein
VKHRAPRPRLKSPRHGVTAALAVALLVTGAAWSGALVGPFAPHDKAAAKSVKHKAKTPAVSATLDRGAYAAGQLMTLRVNDNLWASHTYKVTDTAGRIWTQQSEDNKGAVYTATAGTRAADITVVLTRVWDGASASATLSYGLVAESTPTGTLPTSTTSTPTTATPTKSTSTGSTPTGSLPTTSTPTTSRPPTSSTPTTATTTTTSAPPTGTTTKGQWPGQIPGKFYLGMSCGTTCDSKEAQLGQGYGVHRQFTTWANLKAVAKDIQEDNAAGALPWISMKPPGGAVAGWQAIANGQYDADIHALATTLKANDDKPVLFTFHHEPSNDAAEADGVLWAAAWVHIHDILASDGALVNVSDPPILGEWLWNPVNRTQDPANWLTDAVLQRAPFIGIDLYETKSGETFAQRVPRLLDWLAGRGYPNLMVGIGETGSTDTDSTFTMPAVDWLNQSLQWAADNTDKIGVVAYFNTTLNSRANVYWPLDESAAKLSAYRDWLNKPVTIDRVN